MAIADRRLRHLLITTSPANRTSGLAECAFREVTAIGELELLLRAGCGRSHLFTVSSSRRGTFHSTRSRPDCWHM